MVMRNSKEARSLNLNRLITEKLATLLMASACRLRGMLPNGVPKTDCAVRALTMSRTRSLLTVPGTNVAGLNAGSARLLFREFKLMRVFAGTNEVLHIFTGSPGLEKFPVTNTLHASEA